MALLARWVGPEGFGLFAGVYGIALLVQTVIDFGITTYIVRMRALEPTSEFIRASLELVSRINLCTAIVGLSCAAALSIYNSDFIALLPLSIWVAVDRQVETWLALPLADGDTRQNAMSLVTRRGMALGILIIGAALNFDPLICYATGLAISSGVSCVVVMAKNRSAYRRFKVSASTVLRAARPYWINSVATQARNFDAALVSILVGPAQGGYYGAASRLTTPLRLVPTSFAQVLMPAAVRAGRSNIRTFIRTLSTVMGATVILYVLVGILVPFVVPAILGADFEPAVPVIQIVCAGLVFAAMASQLSALMQAWGHLRAVAVMSTLSTVACLLGIVLAAPLWGGIGAAVALSGSYVVQVLAQAIFLVFVEKRADNGTRIHEHSGR